MTTNWWNNLTPEQQERYNEMVEVHGDGSHQIVHNCPECRRIVLGEEDF